jgi:butyrate kinase
VKTSDEYGILVMNVGSTSTKVACFRGARPVCSGNIAYPIADPARFPSLEEQLLLRERDLMNFLSENHVGMDGLDMVVSRGGLGRPEPAGVYMIDEVMCRDLLSGRYGRHVSALGPVMALEISRRYGVPAVVVDPPSTDEFEPLARISGMPDIERRSSFHALNQKAAARRCAAGLGKRYEEMNVVVAHLGGGITVGAHRKGRVIDCTNGLSEGPLTPERSGALPTVDLVDLALSGGVDRDEIHRRLIGLGGLAAYLGTSDATRVEDMILHADQRARLVYEAMAYQVAKEIGAMAAVLGGQVDVVIITGALARSSMLVGWIVDRVGFLAPVYTYPGEDEMTALAEGGLRVLRGEEEMKTYAAEDRR